MEKIEHNDYVVYIHIRLDKNIPFYVGKGRKNRPYNFKARNKFWKNIYNYCGGNIKVDIIFKDLTEKESLVKEHELDLKLKNEGYLLTNIVETGIIGSSGHKKSQDWKNWYSELMSNINSNRILTEEHKLNISISNKKFGERPWIRDSNLGRIQSEKTRQKKSEKLKGRIQSKTEKDKRSQSNKKSIIQYDLEGNFIKEWLSAKDFALFFNPNNEYNIRTSISACLRKKQETSYGFKWGYNNK